MNPRILTGTAGIVITILGLAGILSPGTIAKWLGYAVAPDTSSAAVLGEVRATYGGVFTVMGVFTLLSTLDPAAHRSRLTLVACMWLGACLARLFGTTVDGTPGILGWISVVFEALVGTMLIIAAWIPESRAATEAPPLSAPTAPPPPATPDGSSGTGI